MAFTWARTRWSSTGESAVRRRTGNRVGWRALPLLLSLCAGAVGPACAAPDAGRGTGGAGKSAEGADPLHAVYQVEGQTVRLIGGLAEAHLDGLVGETFLAILADQFLRTRDGDRFFYETEFDHLLLLDPNFDSDNRLSDIIRRNSSIENIQDDVFRLAALSAEVPEPSSAILAAIGVLLTAGRRRTRMRRLSAYRRSDGRQSTTRWYSPDVG